MSRPNSTRPSLRTVRNAFAVFSVLTLGAAAQLQAQSADGRAPDVSAPAPASDAVEGPLMLLGEMTYVSTEGDLADVVVDAGRARVRPDEEKAHLETVHARLGAAAAGKPNASGGSLDMTCDRGVFEFDSGDFEAEGNVSGTTGDGRRFRTSSLSYVHAEGLVKTNAPVVIRDDAGTYRGRGFRYWVRENRFRLMGGASVVQSQ